MSGWMPGVCADPWIKVESMVFMAVILQAAEAYPFLVEPLHIITILPLRSCSCKNCGSPCFSIATVSSQWAFITRCGCECVFVPIPSITHSSYRGYPVTGIMSAGNAFCWISRVERRKRWLCLLDFLVGPLEMDHRRKLRCLFSNTLFSVSEKNQIQFGIGVSDGNLTGNAPSSFAAVNALKPCLHIFHPCSLGRGWNGHL
jgi:hypothetical protein